MKTVNLELSRQLKEAGYPQESHFAWYIEDDGKGNANLWERANFIETSDRLVIAAPTADEVLYQLPSAIHGVFFLYIWKDDVGLYRIVYCSSADLVPGGKKPNYPVEKKKVLADAVAEMWLHLKKEGLL